MYSEHLLGPFFFDGFNNLNHLAMLGNWFIPQLHSLGIEINVWFQQEGVPPHFAETVREYLNEIYQWLDWQ